MCPVAAPTLRAATTLSATAPASPWPIQKTLGNTFKNAKRQMDAIKSFAAAAKAAADGTLDEEQATSTIGALDASVYGDRTEWIKKADEALAAFQ